MGSLSSHRVVEALRSIPGVRRAEEVRPDLRRRAVDLDARTERASVPPVRNLGLHLLAERDACFAILKDATFRPPGTPTVYLVEEDPPPECAHLLQVEGRRYAIVGEEVIEGGRRYDEPVIPLERSFVIFPERRSGPEVPCLFLLPPIRFSELALAERALGISDVASVSPSPAVDGLLREAFGFPSTNELATLLVGCNRVPLAAVES